MKLRGNDVKKKEKAIEYHPPIAPEKAIRYLMQNDYLGAKTLLGLAKGVAGYFCAWNSGHAVNQFLRTVYDEDYHVALCFIMSIYQSMDEPTPRHILALYSCFPIWKVFMNLVYDAVSEYETGLASPNTIAVIDNVISKALPPELWESIQYDSIHH